MKIISTYSVKIKEYNHIFKDTVLLYRRAVDFFINVCLENWDAICQIKGGVKFQQSYIESLTISTKAHPVVLYDFSSYMYKFPVYMRRSAIHEAIGKVSSYRSNLSGWDAADKRTRGNKPTITGCGYIYPAMYRDNTFVRTGTYTAKLKVFIRNTWDWLSVDLKKSDVDYILRHCSDRKECVPTLQRRGKQWSLDFAFEEKATLNDTDIFDQTAVAVDLGINSSATCSVMYSDGTVIGREFLSLPKEYDCLKHKIGHIKYAQRHGSRKMPKLWAYAKGINDDISIKTANFIINTVVKYNADVIVMEYLDLQHKKRGSKKQRLALWRAQYVQSMVTNKAHRLGIHISHINAWGTSRLAFDGSGKVLRGNESTKTDGNYSVCEFQTDKVYNCDLNASYNIGARYFVREILKSLPATDGQRMEAKVPSCVKRSTCTLSTLINLDTELYAAA